MERTVAIVLQTPSRIGINLAIQDHAVELRVRISPVHLDLSAERDPEPLA